MIGILALTLMSVVINTPVIVWAICDTRLHKKEERAIKEAMTRKKSLCSLKERGGVSLAERDIYILSLEELGLDAE